MTTEAEPGVIRRSPRILRKQKPEEAGRAPPEPLVEKSAQALLSLLSQALPHHGLPQTLGLVNPFFSLRLACGI